MDSDQCIRCRRTADEISEGRIVSVLMWRQRPHHSSEYAVCFACALEIRKREDERAQDAIREAERAGA